MAAEDDAEMALSVARLQRFYGGDPLAWYEMPTRRLGQFVKALAIIMAEERLAYIVDTAVGSGAAKAPFQRSHQRKMRREAERGMGGKRKRSGKFNKAMLAAMNIGTGKGKPNG